MMIPWVKEIQKRGIKRKAKRLLLYAKGHQKTGGPLACISSAEVKMWDMFYKLIKITFQMPLL